MSLAEAAKLQEYVDGMNEAGKKASGGNPGNIAQVKVEFGWHRYISKELGFWFAFVPVPSKDKSDAAKEACYTILKKNGSTESPSFGLRTYIFGETALPAPWKSDSGEFVAIWQSDAYDMLQQRLVRVEGFAFNKTLWARIKNVPDPYFVNKDKKTELRKDRDGFAIKDESGENIYDYKTVRVITEVFPNEIAAQKAASEGAVSNNKTPQLSAKAIENGVTMQHIKDQSSDIAQWLKEKKGKEWIADQLNGEVSDLQFADEVEVPF